MTRRGAASSDEEDESSKKKVKKVKRTGPSLLELERAKYLKNSTTGASKASYDEQGKRVKGKREEPDLLDALSGFRSRVQGAVKSAKLASADNIEEPGIAGEIAAKQGFFSVAGDVDEDVSHFLCSCPNYITDLACRLTIGRRMVISLADLPTRCYARSAFD